MANTSKRQSKTQNKSGASKRTASLEQGDKVEWETSQGKTKGTVKRKVSKPMKIKGHTVKASKDNPQLLVESDKTGKQAAHKAKALKKIKS